MMISGLRGYRRGCLMGLEDLRSPLLATVQNVGDCVSGPLTSGIQSISDTSSNVSDLVSSVGVSSTTSLASFVGSARDACNSFSAVFKSIETLIKPILSVHKYIWSVWSTLSSSITVWFSDLMVVGKDWYKFMCEKLESHTTIIIAALIFIVMLVFLRFLLPESVVHTWLVNVQLALKYVSSFVLSFIPEGAVKNWITSLVGSLEPLIQPQVGCTFGTQTSPFTHGEILSSLIAFGFSSAMYFLIGTDKPGKSNSNPISQLLCATGDHASKMNHLFAFFRNVKGSLSDSMLWLGEWACEVTGLGSPLTATVNQVLNTDLMKWFQETTEALNPQNRLDNFADAQYMPKLGKLRDRVHHFEAEFAKFPISALLSTRFNALVSRLDKALGEAQAHKGVGNFRDEPFCLQFVGKPGCGKTMSINYLITDLLNRLGEPQQNRLYSLSSKDGFWSNYNHQTAVLIDDFGQILDGSNQSDDVKDLIFLKSSAPMSLNMAAVEEKGTQFTSKYIFLTSNFNTPDRTCGVRDVSAIQRRRNMLVEVTRSGPINENCDLPVDPLRFTLLDPLYPFRPQDEFTELTYQELLDLVELRVGEHQKKSTWLSSFKSCDRRIVAQAGEESSVVFGPQEYVETLERREIEAKAKGRTVEGLGHARDAEERLLTSFEYAYQGRLSYEQPFAPCTAPANMFVSLDERLKKQFVNWQRRILYNGIKDCEESFWRRMMTEYQGNHLMAWIQDFDFDNATFYLAKHDEGTHLQDFVTSRDDDAMEFFRSANKRTQFAFALILRHFLALKHQIKSDPKLESHESWFASFVAKIKDVWNSTPLLVRCFLQVYLTYRVISGFVSFIATLFPVMGQSAEALTVATTAAASSMALTPRVSNISQDPHTNSGNVKKGVHSFLVAQRSLEVEWKEWAAKDPFFRDALVDNLVLIRLPGGGVFRGLYVRTGWILTVAHAFLNMPSGTSIGLTHQRSSTFHSFTRGDDYLRFVPEQDLCVIYVGEVDGLKKDITKHFASRGKVICSPGSKAVVAKPIFAQNLAGILLEKQDTGVSMNCNGVGPIQYGEGSFKINCAATFSFVYPGANGDCGSLLLLPALGNRQPVIAGVHCAGYRSEAVKAGMITSFAAAIWREDLEDLLPKQTLLVPQVRHELLSQVTPADRELFPTKQVSWLGTVPKELAMNIPHKTTLRRSELFDTLSEELGPHLTEPSILTSNDHRVVPRHSFDPYVSGVEKFNESCCNIDLEIAFHVMTCMRKRLLEQLQDVPVPGGIPMVREENEVLNGIPGENFYDAMDMSTSCGYPFNLMGFGTSKRGFIEGEPGNYMLDRSKPVYESWLHDDGEIRMGIALDMVSCECAKDERLPLEKIYEKPKTRLFTILPFQYNMLVRKYFLDFSASLMRAHSKVCCKVGINPTGVEWTELANQFLNASDVGFSADYSSFDGRAPVFIFQWFCNMVDEYYGDAPGSENSLARHALLMMASNHYTLCGDKLFRVVGGMPSGFSLTVLFNSLLNEFYMRYAFEVLSRKPSNASRTVGVSQSTFGELFVAIYGDDNLVAVPMHLRWYSLPEIAAELSKINVIIKNGLDKTADVSSTTFQPLGELTFLSRGFKRHSTGFYLAPLKWVSIIEPLRWIRPGANFSAAEALLENVEGSLVAAFMHGQPQFESLKKAIVQAMRKRSFPVPTLPVFECVEQLWLQEITGDKCLPDTARMLNAEAQLNQLPSVACLTKDEINFGVNEFVAGIFFCSARTASRHVTHEDFIMVNCTSSVSKNWIRGPASTRDLQNKVWAYTLSALEIEQQRRCRNGRIPPVLFVCASGVGISLVCAALAALATNQFSAAQIVLRVRQLADADRVQTFANGAGFYLLAAANAFRGPTPHSMPSQYLYGSNVYDRFLKIDNCVIILGFQGVLTGNVPYWCTSGQGFNGVRTNLTFVMGDEKGERLGESLIKARQQGEALYLFFSTFPKEKAEWVLKGVACSGVCADNLTSSDLITLSHHALDTSASPFGKIVLKVSNWFGLKKIEIADVDDTTLKHVATPLPFEASSLLDEHDLRREIKHMDTGFYGTSSLITAGKIIVASNSPGESHKCILKVADSIFTHGDREKDPRWLRFVLTLGVWARLPHIAFEEFIPKLEVDIFKKRLKHVEFIEAEPVFALGNDAYENSIEAMAMSLHYAYRPEYQDACEGKKKFFLSAKFPLLLQVLLPNLCSHCFFLWLAFILLTQKFMCILGMRCFVW
uniref:RNA1 polyprotein n=1 Tax=Lake cress torradovirus TaxID=3115804 RepID=A0AAT9JBN1_9SECO